MLAGLERLRVLHRLSWLVDLPPSHVAPLAEAARERVVPRGRPLADRHVHFVVDGKVDADVFPSPAIGLVEVLARDGSAVSAVAETDCLVLELSANDLHAVLDTSFPLRLAVVRGLTCATLTVIPPVFPVPASTRCDPCIERVARTQYRHPPAVRRDTRVVRVERGTELWHEGERAAYGVVVLAGEIMTWERDIARIDRARPGTSLGIREALVGLPRWHDAIAVADTTFLHVDMCSMLDVLEEQVELAGDLAREIAAGLLRALRQPG
jgi:CRP-like cAMP-binding protein